MFGLEIGLAEGRNAGMSDSYSTPLRSILQLSNASFVTLRATVPEF